MASLIIGSAFFVSEKIKKRKEDKREAKRIAYDKRYEELKTEHKRNERASSAKNEGATSSDSHQTIIEKENNAARLSHESQRDADANDGPSRWVDEANLARSKSQSEH